jgi:UDP-N-acetylmuramyl pentapeptide phosphotransferase/UDP-N-acetylglucosamine-1-phosphate transferase
MNFILYLFLILIFLYFINRIFLKYNFLVSETGDRHQRFTSKNKIPLSGGIFLFLSFLYMVDDNILSFILFCFIVLLLGLFSDLKYIKSAFIRFLFQILIVLSFVVFNKLLILNTNIYLLDKFLNNEFLNYFFVCFCILIIINGSNFLDGLNTLNIGYYLLISLVIYYLESNQMLTVNGINIDFVLSVIIILYFINFLNKVYLGDSGSYLFGFAFAVFLINIYSWNQNISPFFIILLFWYPSYEILFSIIRKNVMNKSPMTPDTNHLHHQIFYMIKKRFKFSIYYSNVLTANLINLYNLIVFIISLNHISNSQIQFLLILLNIITYTFIYFKLFVIRYKKI